MRQGGPNNGRRPRGRHHGGGGERHHGGGGGSGGGGHQGGNSSGPPRDNRPRSAASLRHQTFDSNCIDVRVRGNAWQVHEKYQALARDAQSSGDRVAAENYLQHAEHYFRIIEAINEATAAEQRARGVPVTPAFGQQPEVPTNYYGTPGNPAPQPGSEDANGNAAPQQQQQQAQAEVQKREPQAAGGSFFTAEENEEEPSGPEQIVARR